MNRILALILPALSRCYQSIQPSTNSNALQGRQNRRDVNGEQLTGLEPTTLCSMVAPAQHPNQHPHVGMHIFCTSQKGKKATHTLLHEFSHCLGYKLFEHSHNTLSSFYAQCCLKRRKPGQINSMKGCFTHSQVRNHKSSCHYCKRTIHFTIIRIAFTPSFKQHPFQHWMTPPTRRKHNRFSAQHSPSELCFLRIQITTVLQKENKNTYLEVQ